MSKKLTRVEFINNSIKIHGCKYNYSKSEYTGNKQKIIIECPIHGNFLQTPNDHMMGRGCAKCKNVHSHSTKEFIINAKEKHGGIYDYSMVNYKNAKTHVIIICKIHGKFLQIPNYHLSGNGCRKCAYEKNLNKNYSISSQEIKFLNYQNIIIRNVYVGGYYVDGIVGNEIYEFLGDYWHGNPLKFDHSQINNSVGKTFGELYDKTFIRFFHLKSKGYIIKYIWENDWKRFSRGIDTRPNILVYI